RRLVLRNPAARAAAGDDRVRGGVPRVRGAGDSARRVHHARSALSRDRLARRGNRHSDRGGRDPRHLRDGSQPYRRSRRRHVGQPLHPGGGGGAFFMSSVSPVVNVAPMSTVRSNAWYPGLVILTRELPSGRNTRLTVPVAVVVT